jgi:hypothetical protein
MTSFISSVSAISHIALGDVGIRHYEHTALNLLNVNDQSLDQPGVQEIDTVSRRIRKKDFITSKS